jgi:hypothetical protein
MTSALSIRQPCCPDVWLLGVEDESAPPRALSCLACIHWRGGPGDIISIGLILNPPLKLVGLATGLHVRCLRRRDRRRRGRRTASGELVDIF